MSGRSFGSRSRAGAENWQLGQDYWIYLPDDVFPSTSYLNPRGRTSLLEDGWMGGSNYGLASVPSAALPRPSPIRLLLIDAYNPRARSPTPPPTYYEWSGEDESGLSQEDQKQALNKLRKQLYNPHMSNIIRRLGSSKSSSSTGGSLQDDDGKRCAVCLEDFESKQFVTVTPCNHMFHEECIVPWVKSQGKCPVCRFVLADDHRNEARQRSNGSAAAAAALRRGGIPLRY